MPLTPTLFDQRATAHLAEERLAILEHDLVGGDTGETLGDLHEVRVPVAMHLPLRQCLLVLLGGLLRLVLLEHRTILRHVPKIEGDASPAIFRHHEGRPGLPPEPPAHEQT